ncbi:hypothetical protein [Paenibacillus macerans]|uniref:TlpA family protein disulfide reductase n=1 Tax=Paenibacillus macerans TaxID=44252 RepID=UPI00204217D2|nr:hypothetical protein [Paenibacillus macerans]MCM3701656.1 hypothetical protein [Paenibacillus macerans]
MLIIAEKSSFLISGLLGADRFGVTALPTTYIIDVAGEIAQPIIGEISSEDQLQTYIDTVKED